MKGRKLEIGEIMPLYVQTEYLDHYLIRVVERIEVSGDSRTAFIRLINGTLYLKVIRVVTFDSLHDAELIAHKLKQSIHRPHEIQIV